MADSAAPVLVPSSLGTLLATLAGNHFDVVKTRQMLGGPQHSITAVLRMIARSEGKKVLLSGIKPALVAGVAGNALYFLLYETLKHRATDALGSIGFGLAAFASRAAAVTVMIPVEVARTRAYASADTLQQVSVFRGLQTQVWRDVLWSTFCWQLYETTFPRLESAGVSHSLSSVLCGIAAGVGASVLTHPLDLLKTRLQVGESLEENTFLGLRGLWAQERSRIFTLGLSAHCLKSVVNMSVFMYVYTTLRQTCHGGCVLC